jgi:hypothetical protein
MVDVLEALYRAGSRRQVDVMVLIGGVEEWGVCTRLPNAPSQYIFILRMASCV